MAPIICAVLILAIVAIAAVEQEHSVIASSPLYMDVEWVMQGWKFGFQGFYVEFLGYTSALRSIMPNSRIVQSSFRKTYSDPPVDNITQFYKVDMLPEEGVDAYWLQERELSPVPENGYPIPKSPFAPAHGTTIVAEDVCVKDEDSTSNSNGILGGGSNLLLMDGDLGRGIAQNIDSQQDCCRLCVKSPLCIGWTYSINDKYCMLKRAKSHQLSRRGFTSGLLTGPPLKRITAPRAVIFHGTSCFHNNVTFNRMDMDTIYIGRYMVERADFTRGKNIDELSVLSCAARLDEIWVPTMWHYHLLRAELQNLGFPNPQIYVIPEAIDTRLFDPEIVRARVMKNYKGNNPEAENNSMPTQVVMDMDGSVKSGITGPNPTNFKNKPFQFLSIFKWEQRKGWDILLKAYWSTFTKEDNVVLRLRTYVPNFALNGGDGNITNRISYFANSEFHKDLHELARVEWVSGVSPNRLSDAMTRGEMQELMIDADCFVLPTRGEGWGLPIVEAMALELPVIVTNYSGITAYATEDNAYLIPVENRLDIEGFSQPKVDVLAQLMRQVIIDSEPNGNGIAKEKGKKARESMKHFSPTLAVSMMAARLRELAKMRGWEFQ